MTQNHGELEIVSTSSFGNGGLCAICGASNAQPHFGGVSCRSCAAFFRRLVHSKKKVIKCTCKTREDTHPCRQCRMVKCLAAGMSRDKVQLSRDKNLFSERLACTPPLVSLLNCRIVPRDSPNINTVISNWSDFEKKRKIFQDNRYELMNLYEFSCYARSDCEHILNLFQDTFPQIRDLKSKDKEKLIANLLPKWIILESCLDFVVNFEEWSKLDEKANNKMIIDFYGSAIPMEKRMRDEDVLKTFGVYWNSFYYKTVSKIHKMNFDKFEYSALFLLLLFDPAYTNISEDCAKLCETARKVILRELKGYQVDQNFEENRFFDTLDSLLVIDKGEREFEEEMLVCEMNNVKLDGYFREVMFSSKI